MRRSAAPSQYSHKRAKFCTPYSNKNIENQGQDIFNVSHIKVQSKEKSVITGECTKVNVDNTKPNVPDADITNRTTHKGINVVRVKSANIFKVPSKETRIPSQPMKEGEIEEVYFSVVWCKCSNKKHKSWEGDGVLIVKGKMLKLLDSEGKQIAKGSGYSSNELKSCNAGSILRIGGKEIEIQGSIPEELYRSGKCFSIPVAGNINESVSLVKQAPVIPFQLHSKNQENVLRKSKVLTPRHNPDVEGALIMQRPPNNHSGVTNIVDVVVDPYLSVLLRPHQRKGVTFLYNCVMGFGEANGCGAILADEMGLGKTLQCISLVWTLLKQGPYSKPIVKNVLIVTPGSLVKNWYKEFMKWLGSERISPFAANSKNRVDEFLLRPKNSVLIISYEMFMRCFDDVRKVKFGLIICDEAHRLKNSTIKTSTLINSLAIPKRILLTGTPIQNNLEEFYTLADISNPGMLGTMASFKRIFIAPLTRVQQRDCTEEEKLLAVSRSEELTRLTSQFCLRRTAEVNKSYLPLKVEHVVFVKISPVQKHVYINLLKAKVFRSCLSTTYSGSQHLVCISALKKLCNDPGILYSSVQDKDEDMRDNVMSCFPDNFEVDKLTSLDSCKLSVLEKMLEGFQRNGEKVVVVANSTKALDKLKELCDRLNVASTRLDGQTATDTRQRIVDRFNSAQSDLLVFLLSSKAGGVGLNLVGASRLVLYDIDWNPANDVQAMARIWRDGQKREVHIYRLLVTGTIEEKIYQRQLQKQCLSGSVVDSLTHGNIKFTAADLKDLFTYNDSITCCTHELLHCQCDQETQTNVETSIASSQKNLSMAELMSWEHIKDVKNTAALASGLSLCDNVSFLFRNRAT